MACAVPDAYKQQLVRCLCQRVCFRRPHLPRHRVSHVPSNIWTPALAESVDQLLVTLPAGILRAATLGRHAPRSPSDLESERLMNAPERCNR